MKKIKFISIFFLSIFMILISCVDSESSLDVDHNIVTEGTVTTLKGTSGKLLGSVVTASDLANSEVILSDTNAELTLNLAVLPGQVPANVSKYQIVKSFKGGEEVVVAEANELPISVNYNTVNEFLDGLNLNLKSLRIGDQIEFRVKVFTTTGNVYYEGSSFSKYDVTINCASDLAGNYSWGTYKPSLDLVQVSPGVYRMPYLANFSSSYWFEFKDVCGSLTITDWQYAGGNPITQNEPGYINAQGDIVFPSIDVAGVAWFVDLELIYTKN